jgi:AAA domain
VFDVYERADDYAPDVPPGGPDDYRWTAGDTDGSAQAPAPGGSETIAASLYRWIEPVEIEPRQWLHGRHFIRKFLSATVSAGGIGKSSLELLDAVSMACGRDLVTGKQIEPRSCWYWNGEDPLEELQRRVQAVALSYGLTDADLGGRLYLDSGRAQRIRVASDDRRHGITINRPLVDSLAATLQANRIDALILDPFVSTHGVPENDNGAIDQVAKELAGIAEAANCAVEVVHHVRKTNGGELTADDARGAVALIGAARSVRVLNPMSQDEAAKAGIEINQRRLYFRVDNGKANLAPPSDNASWRQLVSVGLGNRRDPYPEDSVGVVKAWKWPDAFAGLTADHLKAVQNKIGGGAWRADVQAGAWVGKAVAEALGLDVDEDGDKARIKSLLKTWLKNGSLVEVERQDEGRKARRHVEVGKWVEK